MSDEDEPKVVSLKSRRPYVHPTPDYSNMPDPDGIDRGSIMALSDVIERLEKGELCGCSIMAWNVSARRFENMVCIPAGQDLQAEALKYAGGAALLKEDLINLHLYGDEKSDGDNEDFDEDDMP
jgi:hypothetical protein